MGGQKAKVRKDAIARKTVKTQTLAQRPLPMPGTRTAPRAGALAPQKRLKVILASIALKSRDLSSGNNPSSLTAHYGMYEDSVAVSDQIQL